MAKKTKYFFDPHSLTYEIAHTSWGKMALRVFGFLSASAVLGAIIMAVSYTYFSSPKEKILEDRLDEYRLQVSLYEKTVDELSASLEQLNKRDEEIYRVVFEAPPLQDSTKNPQSIFERYKNKVGLDEEDNMERMKTKLANLASRMKVQSASFDDILERAKRKQDMLASIPAIQPISNKELDRVASGFGYRIHPIYKTVKMHSGMDFTASKGTPIYATGNGTVTFAGYNEGYGYHVIINHGYGYESLYAHMTKIEAKQGQSINRGQRIGTVGSSGLSTAPHLHYEIIKNGDKVNPVHFYYNDLSPEDYERIKELAAANNQSFD
ncbi:MAG: M23 family metallopeptidase [Bacteroidetes bacterium]|nr:MAG: M23 family metallopeptidase [Bacteroidota bacterium]